MLYPRAYRRLACDLIIAGCLVPCLAGMPAGADGPPGAAAQSGLDQLQGAWERETTESGSVKRSAPARLVIEGDTFLFGDARNPEKVVIADRATPRAIDLTPIGAGAGPLRGVTYFGIYKLEGDTLTLCLDIRKGSVRPGNFAPESPLVVTDVYKRSKAKR